MTTTGLRATRTIEWTCGDLSARITYAVPSAREHAALSAAAATGTDPIASLVGIAERALISAHDVTRGDLRIASVSPPDLLDALSPSELDSLVGAMVRGGAPR